MSISHISVETATFVYYIAYAALIAGAILTVAGLLGLFLAEGVRNKDHETKIAEAQARSDEARADVAKANEGLAQANERASRLESDAAQARLEQERLTASNLELAATLERERAARGRIETGLSSRHVSAQQKDALVKVLRGSGLTVVVSTYSDVEATAYAKEIISALKAAGITTLDGTTILATAGMVQGLFIEETASRVIAAFQTAGFSIEKMPATKNVMMKTGEGLNAIFVGLKPTAF